jgi:hypothetical protein
VRSPLLEAGRRIRAARLLMSAADGNLDEALAHETYLINRDLHAATPVTRLMQRLTALSYHSVFGDRAEAMQLVRAIEDLVSGGERSWYTSVGPTACSIAREIVGDGPWDYADVERTYAECLEASMRVGALACASRLTSMLIHDGNVQEARGWMRAAEELWVTLGGASTPVDYHTSQIDLALLEGVADRARAALAAMTHGAEYRTACDRLANRLAVYRTRVALMCDRRRPTEESLVRLLQHHERAKRFGRHDDHMQVLWSSLRAVGRSDDASRLLHNYLRFERRERRSCCYLLRLATVDDPEWTRPDES